MSVRVTGRGGVSGVSAVVLSVMAFRPSRDGFVSVFPAGGSRPVSRNGSFTAGGSASNMVVAKVGSGGNVTLTNVSSGTVRLIGDVSVISWREADGVVQAKPMLIDPAGDLTAVSCATPRFCVAVSRAGTATVRNGGASRKNSPASRIERDKTD
ncbi:hypothetical protein [Terrabacter sp. MAHUQ-38]|uniref:hypothetical protein n=1 Tax=unclassified Terrabacter TaxID=2630222 RepID=UPI00165DD312|nr:hypothetical protein [Terrabacter sp. MAHUQ-38]MBC9823731.1 hypothetical protein [Terrabacter sp. MAHUQ-38]